MNCKPFYTLLLLLTALAANAQSTWWGLWNAGLGLQERSPLYAGQNTLYVRLTSQNSPQMVDAQVSGLRFYLNDKSSVKSARVWLSTSYSQSQQPTIVSKEVDLAQLRDLAHDQAATEVAFDQSYAVLPSANRYANLYAGVTLELDANPTTALMAGEGKGPGYSCFYNGNDVAGLYGALALQLRASGPNMATRSVAAALEADRRVLLKNTQATLSLPARNDGAETVGSIDYTVSIDGTPQATRHYALPTPVDQLGMAFAIPISYTVPAASGEHTLTVAIDKVNGQPNESAEAQAQTALLVLDRPAQKRAVMEEFTGTWCLNCVRGIAGIRLLEEQFGDRFMAIAMHSDDPAYDRDPMVVSHYRNSTFYKNKMKILGGLPSCSIDRWIDGDPYCGYNTYGPFETDQLVNEALSRPAMADLIVRASWTDDTETAIAVGVATTFAYNSNDCPYRLILVLTADGLTGDTDRWRQRNGYNDYTGDEEPLKVYAGLGTYLPDRTFNHVAIDIVGVDDGIEGSITAPLVSGQPQSFVYELPTADNQLVQDHSRLSAIAMLIDTRDGSVVNAAKAHVEGTSAIQTAQEATSTAHGTVYDLQGRRIAMSQEPGTRSLKPGLYVVNGRKVVVR